MQGAFEVGCGYLKPVISQSDCCGGHLGYEPAFFVWGVTSVVVQLVFQVGCGYLELELELARLLGGCESAFFVWCPS